MDPGLLFFVLSLFGPAANSPFPGCCPEFIGVGSLSNLFGILVVELVLVVLVFLLFDILLLLVVDAVCFFLDVDEFSIDI